MEERTSELTAANQELLALTDELTHTLTELKDTQKQLVQSEKLAALGGMVAGVAHELNTPVGNIVTTLSYLQKELKSAQAKSDRIDSPDNTLSDFWVEAEQIIDMNMRNLERVNSLIRNFKMLATDQAFEGRRRFNVRSYLDELLPSLDSELNQSGHRISVSCPDDLELFSFPGAFGQIVTNLITNSLKHGFDPGDHGELSIEIVVQSRNVVLTYQDNGKGIPQENLDRIFDPFFTTKRGAEGSVGLGLHMVYNAVTQALNGIIQCESPPEGGTRFTIIIPYYPEDLREIPGNGESESL